ncbi:MAG: sterol desaturase family protein [Pontixanthobacter sp.]
MSDSVFESIATFFRNMVDAQMTGQGFLYMFGYYMGILMLERVLYLFQSRHKWDERDAIANVKNSVFMAVVEPFVGAVIFVAVYSFIFEYLRVYTFPIALWAFLVAWLMNDFAYYLGHRIEHRTGFFWAIHHTHHSSNEMNILVANRGNLFNLGETMRPTNFLLAFAGVPLAMFVTVKFFGNLWGIFNHTRLVGKMGPLEHILATPSNHRVHHGADAKYLDRNYGQVLILWDRLFGTFQREEEYPRFGLVVPLESRSLWDIQTAGFQWLFGQMKTADRWSDKLRYLIKPPGWSHDGRHETSETIQQRAENAVDNTHSDDTAWQAQ